MGTKKVFLEIVSFSIILFNPSYFRTYSYAESPSKQDTVHYNLIVASFNQPQSTRITGGAEFDDETIREIELLVQKQLSVLPLAVSREIAEHIGAVCNSLVDIPAADGIGVGVGQCFDFLQLQSRVGVVEGEEPRRVRRTCGVHVVLELPVVPTCEVLICVFCDTFDLGYAFGSIGHAAELRHDSRDAQPVNVLLPPFGIDGVVKLALEGSQREGTVGVVVQQVFAFELAERLVEASDHVLRGGFEEQQFILLDLSDLLTDFFVEREQDSVVVLVGTQERIRILPKVPSSGLIDDVIANHIFLSLEVFNHFEPHFNEFVVHSIFVGEEIMGKTYHIVRDVVFKEAYLSAVLLEREPLLIFPQLDLQGGWEVGHLPQPSRKTLPTVLSAVEIVVGIQNDADSITFGLPHYPPQNLQVCVVVFVALGFEPLPCNVQPQGVDSPVFQVDKVLLNQRVIGVEDSARGIERKLFVDYVESMHDSDSIVLVPKHIAVAIYGERTPRSGADCEQNESCLDTHPKYYHYYHQISNQSIVA